MVDALEEPEFFAGIGVKGEQRVGEEIVPQAIEAVEIGDRGAGGDEEDAAAQVDRHPGPVVGCPGGPPGIRRPGFVACFAGVGNGVEAPDQLAGKHVIRANIAARRGVGFWRAKADDEQVLVERAGRGKRDVVLRVV